MSFDFDGQRAVVTGAAGGIGRAVCLSLARAGARVLAVDLSAEAGEDTADLVREAGGEALFVAGDVSLPETHASYAKAAADAWGGIDIFMNNAGWQGEILSIIDYPLEVFDKVMAINVRGVFLGLKTVLPVMVAQRAGAVVNTASLASHIGSRNLAPYAASKHAVMGLTKSAATEVARKGVRVNAVCPGPVDTEMLRDIEAGQSPDAAEALRAKRAASIPEGRYAEATEIADLMMYLVSGHASHITGQGIHINGGAYGI
ncbi:glucose 1-dehydrogenase [Sulfitobacter sp. HNIBRBA3233]|uniref:SDR family NAD(P)-dependent oxidoreductase n=1 Tax=Sulfitobacter marinivivus TaxID=3158558 RepID=UPI0032DEEA1A